MYIEIAKGITVKKEEIEAVVKKDEYTSIVYTHHNTFQSTFPYTVLLQLLNKSKGEQERIYNIMKEQGNFSG